ncbi:MAG: response regulator [Acidobacteriota bacterium]|jgi:two-component system phosphate regulon response regulator PhoB
MDDRSRHGGAIEDGFQTVLLVEDDHDLRALLELTLEAPRRRIVTAGDGVEALDLVDSLRPDLLLTDWMLPGLSGIELLEHLRRNEETARIPVIMITIRDDARSRQRALAGGVHAFLTKPFRPSELQAAVERALAGARVRP